MLVFPQLLTGATAQYPLVRADRRRTAVNVLGDGREVKYTDAAGAGVHWDLRLNDLTSGELAEVLALHEAVEGRLQAFTLLDPASNLLTWSEDFTRVEWLKDPLLTLTGGMADPHGGTSATGVSNAGQASQSMHQSVDGPGGFAYSFSVWGRSVADSNVTLARTAGGVTVRQTFALDSTWRRILSAGQMGSTGDGLSAAVEVGPGAAVQLFGAQLEAQPSAGAYKKSGARGGVYSKVRFEDDALDITATGVNRNGLRIRLVSVE